MNADPDLVPVGSSGRGRPWRGKRSELIAHTADTGRQARVHGHLPIRVEMVPTNGNSPF